MIFAPIAGALADRYGNRVFMALGLALQGIGLAWVAAIATPDVGYAELGVALTIAGIGTSLTFPTVSNAVMGSVPRTETGVASGANSAIRQLGGVFGVAVLAAVFAHQGGYATPQQFTDGFTTALWVGVALSGLGLLAALAAPRRRREHAGAQVALATE
jgi:MFS family permease